MKPDKDERVDQLLEGALRHYGSAEPRGGLEGRILAHLETERARMRPRLTSWLAAAGAAAAIVLVATWLAVSSHNRKSPADVANSTKAMKAEGQSSPKGSTQTHADEYAKKVAVRRKARPRSVNRMEATSTPRLDQFPSQRPLSEQEQLLVRYATELPQEAVTMAREQAELRQEFERWSAENNLGSNSDQQER